MKQEQEERLKKEKEEEEEEGRLQKLKDEQAAKQLQIEKTVTTTTTEASENLSAAIANTPKPVEASPFTMLTPQIISKSTNQNFAAHQTNNGTNFDPLEFENQNDNPFEIAERATLNEFDVLRSVLEPESQTNQSLTVIKSAENNNTDKEDFELSSIFYNQPVVTTATDTLPTSQLITVADTTTSNIPVNLTYVAPESFNSIPHQPFKGTLNWSNFTSPPSTLQHEINPFVTNNPFQPNFQSIDSETVESTGQHHLLSKTPPPSFGYRDLASGNQNPNESYENSYENLGTLTRTKSMPNLPDQMPDYENVEQISLNSDNSVVRYKSETNSPQSQNQQHVGTGRIENIMKQYQFQRIGQQPPSTSNHSQINTGTYIDSTPHALYDVPPSRDNCNTSTYQNQTFPNQNSVNTLSGVMIQPPAYMPPLTNIDYANYIPNSSTIIPNSHSNSAINTFSSNESGPLVVNSRISTPNVGQPYNINMNQDNPDSVININPNNINNRLQYSNHQPQQLPPLSANPVYSVPSFGSSVSDNAPPLPYPRQPYAGSMPSQEPIRPPKRPSSAKLDVSGKHYFGLLVHITFSIIFLFI